MDKELQNQLSVILQKLSNAVEQGGTFAMEQLPDVVHQWMMFSLIQNILSILVFFPVLYLWYKTTFTWTNQTIAYGEWSGSKVLTFSLGGVIVLLCCYKGVSSLLDTIKILIAPKLWIIEHIASLLK